MAITSIAMYWLVMGVALDKIEKASFGVSNRAANPDELRPGTVASRFDQPPDRETDEFRGLRTIHKCFVPSGSGHIFLRLVRSVQFSAAVPRNLASRATISVTYTKLLVPSLLIFRSP